MRTIAAFAAVAAVACGIVIPDEIIAEQLTLVQSPGAEQVTVEEPFNVKASGWEYAVSAFDSFDPETFQSLLADLDDGDKPHPPGHAPPPGHPPPPPGEKPPPHHPWPPHHGHHPHPPCNITALELLQASNHTKIFVHLITTYSSNLTELLNSTAADSKNVTVLAPLDEGFKRLKKHFKKHHGDDDEKPKMPSNETIEKFLSYHVVEGKKPFVAMMHAATLPTLLDGGEDLGGEMQRIRLQFTPGFFHGGLKVNFLSKVVFPNHPANGSIVHFLTLPLFPPPPALTAVSFLPSIFSTLSLALEKTNLSSTLASMTNSGGTFFFPTNRAFRALGPKINAFLFNTEKGLSILKAILKYHVAPDYTFYSDAFYKPSSEEVAVAQMSTLDTSADPFWTDEVLAQEEAALGMGDDSWNMDKPKLGKIVHADLPTLLKDKSLSVDSRRHGLLGPKMWVNHIPVVVMNGVAKDGVVHIPAKVLLPPHPHHKDGEDMTVDELVERFGSLVEAESEKIDEL